MKSPTVLNYEVRPCKFVERRMLLSVLSRIIPLFQQEYQYIGFGGLSFTDFKMFHRELHINQMFSIEYGYPKEKLEFNKPYSCIQIHPGRSIDELSKIDLTKPSIIWLDYDGCLNSDIFEDLEIIFNRIPHGSIYLMSCNRQMRNGDNQDHDTQHACISSWFSFNVVARLPTAWAPAKYSLKAEPMASAAANGANILFIIFLALAAIVFST